MAVKFLTRMDTGTARDRFLREGNLLRQLSSPNIVQVIESVETNNCRVSTGQVTVTVGP